MAQRRCLRSLTGQTIALLFSCPNSLPQALETLPSLSSAISIKALLTSKSPLMDFRRCTLWSHFLPRFFSSNSRENGKHDEEEEDDDDDGEEMVGESSDGEEVTASGLKRESSSAEGKEAEAASIGYKVIGPLQQSDRVFKLYEPIFAVVQIGSHQFKVSNGDCIFVERLKYCEVNDKLILNKVLLLGSSTQTIIGRPILPDAAVHSVVEEHALDAKVIIFKKKRRKNYRRTKGHRQELTKLRITDIQGIEKPEPKVVLKPKKEAVKTQEKVAVTA